MARINLLPWREQVREECRRKFLVYLAASSVASVLVMCLVHWIFSNKISTQKTVNKMLTNQIIVLDVKIEEIKKLKKKRAQLLSRMELIQELQANRPLTVHLFDEIVTVLPDGVNLNSFERKEKMLTVGGQAESNTRVSTLMRRIDASQWMTSPLLTEIKTSNNNGEQTSTFKMEFQQTSGRRKQETA